MAGGVLAATTLAGAPASAASAMFNPFEETGGFTVVSLGDARLSNSELEGSIAVLGSLSSGSQNGYAVIHKAAGRPDYTVPVVDGVPVRILAGAFTGTGAFDVSNRDDSASISPTSAEAVAVARFGSIASLTGSARGGGVGPAAGGDFLRVMNATGGVLDLKAVPFASSDVADLATESPIGTYFASLEAGIARADRCLASLSDADADLVNDVTVTDQGGMVMVEGFSTTRANVLEYADVADRSSRIERA